MGLQMEKIEVEALIKKKQWNKELTTKTKVHRHNKYNVCMVSTLRWYLISNNRISTMATLLYEQCLDTKIVSLL